MWIRIRMALGFALMALLVTALPAFAKGGFSFITITGPNLEEEIRLSDPALTEDFFAFADFYRDQTNAPADPGAGYEITRYYLDGNREIAFDHLHYYPETGFVYYDGIVNGSSEYDGEWYTAGTTIKSAFENALSVRAMDQIRANASTVPMAGRQLPLSLSPIYVVLLGTLGLALIFLFTYRLRKSIIH
jgi:hypothetical protein